MKDHDLMVTRSMAVPAEAAPVLKVAAGYLEHGARYAHQQVVLLAVLCVSRHIPLPLGGRRMVRTVLDQATGAVNAMAERGQHPMICSEFVYRCFAEAQPNSPYVLKIGEEESGAGGSLLDWAQANPVLDALRPHGHGGRFDAMAAEKVLAPLVSAYAASTTPTASIAKRLPGIGTAPVPRAAAVSDPSEEELLASMTAFGTALHHARTGEKNGSLPPREAVAEIRSMHEEPNFVTPGDLLRSASLVEIHRQTSPA